MPVKIVSKGKIIIREPTWWDRLLCRIFGHIKIKNNSDQGYYVKSDSITIEQECPPSLTYNCISYDYDKYKYCLNLIPCKRCGMYEKTSIEEFVPLSEDEKIIKDLIE